MKKLVTLFCIVCVFGTPLLAQNTISFQGKLIEGGTAVNGTRNFQFSIPDVSWIESHSNVSVVEGLYSVTLGNGDTPTPLPQLFEGVTERQLIISVDGNVLTPVTLTAPYQNRYFDGDVTLDEGNMQLLSQGVPVATISAAEGFDQNGDPIGEQFGLINLAQTGGGLQSFLGSGRLIFEDPDGGPTRNGSELNWNSMSIFGVDDEIDGQLVFNWMNGGAEGRNRGAIFLWGDQATKDATGVDIWRAALNVRDDDFGKDVGWLALGGPHAGGSTPVGVTAFVEAGAFVTDEVGDNHGGKLFIRGVNSDDPLGSFEVLRDGDGNEWASLVVRSSDGTEKVIDPFSSGGNEPIDIVIDVPGGGEESITVIRGVAQGEANDNWQRGLVGEANTDLGFNMGVHGIANAPAGNDEFSYGVYGTADGDGSGVHYGVRGEINNSPASLNIAVRGRAAAEGDGSEFAAQFGGWFNSQNNLTQNIGVRAFANTNSGSNNYGIWATGQGGDGTNYAGRFDGDIQINSDRMSMGRKDWEPNPQLPFFAFRGTQEQIGDIGDCDGDPNTPDEPCPFLPDLIWMNVEEDGQGNEIGVLNMRSSDGTELRIDPFGTSGGGQTDININDPDGNSVYSANVVSTDIGSGPEPPYAGESFHWGGGTPNIQMGAPIWENENNGAQRGFITLFGSTPDEGGGWYRGFAHMSVNRENGNEYGIFGLEGPSTPNISFSAHGYEGGSGADRPFFDMYGSTSSFDPNDNNCDDPNTPEFEPCINYPSLVNFDIQDDGNGNEIGVLHLRSSDGTEFRLDPFGQGNPNFQNLNINNANNDNSVVDISHHGPTGDYGFISMRDASDPQDGTRLNLSVNDNGVNSFGQLSLHGSKINVDPGGCDDPSTPEIEDCIYAQSFVDIYASNDTGGSDPNGWSGRINLQGTNTPNFELGAHQYQNNDLPYMRMFGSTTVTDTNDPNSCDDPNTPEIEFCSYNPTLIELDVQDDGNGNEVGVLHLRSTDGTDFRLDPFGLGNPNFQNLNVLSSDGQDNVVELGHHGQNGNIGFIHVRGSDGSNKANLYVNEDGSGNEWGSLNLNSPSGYDNIFTNYKTWETGNEDLPIFSMRGSLQQSGGIGDCDGDPGTPDEECFFRPDLINLQVQGNGGVSEAATLDLNNDSGSANISLGLGGSNQDSPFINFNRNGSVPLSINTFEDGTSNLNINGPNGTQSVNIGNGGFDGNFGRVSLMDNGGVNRVELNVSDQGAGELSLGSLSNTPNVSLGSTGTDGNFGQLTLHNDVGDPKAELRVNDDGAGSNFATLDLTNNWDNSAIHLNASSGSIRFTDAGGSEVWLNGLTLNGLNTNSIDKDFVNAITHVQVGNYFGSDMGSGPTDGGYIGADGSIDGANLHVRGNVDADGQVSAGGMVLTSDRRLKDKITPLNGALDNTLKLRGVSYYWKDKLKGERQQIGVIAQEVEEIYPEFVHTNQEGMKSVNYTQMVAVLIESVKELNAKIESLQAENTELKASLANKSNANTKSIELLTTQLNNLQQQINLLIKQPHTSQDDVEISEQK